MYLQNAITAAQEVSSIVVSVEADEIRVKNTLEDFVTDWQDAVDFTAWEWCVKEEADFDVSFRLANLLSNHGRHEHEVVVVNPD